MPSKNKSQKGLDAVLHGCYATGVKSAKSIAATVRLDPATHRTVRLVCADLNIAIQEFLRRAVVRELLYNGKRLK